MKRIFSLFFGLILGIFVMFSSSVFAEGLLDGIDISVSASQDFYTKYVWRGMLLDDDAVSQTELSISTHGLTLGYWGSSDMQAKDDLASEEQDFYIDYTYELEKLSLSLGYTHYHFPDGNAYSEEAYIGFALDSFLSPSLTVYYDFGDVNNGGGEGRYVSLGLSHSFELSGEISLDLSSSFGYNDELFIDGEGYDIGLSAGLNLQLTENLSVSPNINYSLPFGDLKEESIGNQEKQFYAGVSFAYSF